MRSARRGSLPRVTTEEPRPATDPPLAGDSGPDDGPAGEPGLDDGAPPPLQAPEISRMAAGSTRRAPRYGRFVGVGVVVGLALATVVTLLGPSGPVLGRDAVFLLLAVGFGTAGALLGALGAVLAERRRG